MVEWIDSVPLSKISAFGGDYSFVDAVYGHQQLARENVSQALAVKVDEGLFDVDRACEIARLWFYDNPCASFNCGTSSSARSACYIAQEGVSHALRPMKPSCPTWPT